MVQFLVILVLSIVMIAVLLGWRRDRKLLFESRKSSQGRDAERTAALEKSNEDLRASQIDLQRRWRYLAEAQRLSHSGTFGWKVHSGELVWSDETYDILGFARETNPTLDLVFDRVHPEDRDRLQQIRDRATQNGMDLDVEHRILLPDGVIKYVHVVAHAGRDNSGNLEYVGVVANITERKRAEEDRKRLSLDLQESKARLEEAQRVAHMGHYYWDLSANRVIWSDELYRIYGLPPQEAPIDMAMVRELIHPDDREHVFRSAEEAIHRGVHTEAEHRIVRPSGEVRTVQGLGTVKRDASGRAYEMFGTVQDITDRKRAEEALQRSQFYLSEGQRLAHMGSWASNDLGIRWSEGLDIYWSDEVYKIFGLDPQNGPPNLKQYLDAIHPDDRASMAENIRMMHEQRCGCDVTKRIVRPNGDIRYVRCVGVPIFESGVFKAFHGTTIDVTEHELLTHELRREKAYLAEAQSLAHIGSWATNLVTRQVFHSSEENNRLYGFDVSQSPNPFDLHYSSILAEDEPALTAKLENAVRAGADFDVEYRIRRSDGTIRFLRGIGHHNPAQEFGEYFGITIDITDRKRAEEERERLRRLEADLAHINRVNMMGELAAALAHEIKQPIAAAAANAGACLGFLNGEHPDILEAREAASGTIGCARRAAEIIDHVRSLFKKNFPQREPVDVNELIREISLLLKNDIRRNSVTVRLELAESLPEIAGDRVQLEQVLMNLMLNAIEAMHDAKGDLTITSQSTDDGDLSISVSDTGVGIPADKVDQIFDTFFTTKPQGTGMGLAISRSIVESHGGRLWATSNSEGGSTFQFILPYKV
jgi:PAS domain S-box-containing protein